jgi:hypothetical protein
MDEEVKSEEVKTLQEIQYFPAKVVAFPAKWNTFCYIVECNTLGKHSPLFFSEKAPGKPVNKQINDEGYIYKKMIGPESYVYVWEDTINNE